MKVFIVLLVASLAVASQASYLPTNAWDHSGAWNGWNVNGWSGLNGWTNNGWNAHQGWAAYPYSAAQWSSAWPAAPAVYGGHGLYGHKTVVQANVGHNAWGLPWGTYGAGNVYGGWGHHAGLAHTIVPVSKQIAATPGSVHVAPVPVGGERVDGH